MIKRMLFFVSILCMMSVVNISNPAFGMTRDVNDKNITEAVEQILRVDEGVDAHLIDVECKEGVVTLSGQVYDLLSKERATKVTKAVRGVQSVINMIKVKSIKVSDKIIQLNILQALKFEPVIELLEVLGKVSDGNVVLSGEVDSWVEKKTAEQVVKSIKGIRGVENNIIVGFKETRLDSEIKEDVERKLSMDPYMCDILFDVIVNQGNVILKGVIGSANEKDIAYNDAWCVRGVKDVDTSGLTVNRVFRDDMRKKTIFVVKTDLAIKRAIEEALIFDPRVQSFKIDVEVDEEDVTLRGVVTNIKARKAAGKDARNTLGVWTVRNYIKVRPKALPEYDDLKKNIQHVLDSTAGIKSEDIGFKVNNHKVYLKGVIDSKYEKYLAEEAVDSVPGVVEVKNNLVADPHWEWKSDQELKENIEYQLYWNLHVDSDNIDVQVTNGIATLSGEVHSWHEVFGAIKNALEGGAKSVKTNLTVNNEKISSELYSEENYLWRD